MVFGRVGFEGSSSCVLLLVHISTVPTTMHLLHLDGMGQTACCLSRLQTLSSSLSLSPPQQTLPLSFTKQPGSLFSYPLSSPARRPPHPPHVPGATGIPRSVVAVAVILLDPVLSLLVRRGERGIGGRPACVGMQRCWLSEMPSHGGRKTTTALYQSVRSHPTCRGDGASHAPHCRRRRCRRVVADALHRHMPHHSPTA